MWDESLNIALLVESLISDIERQGERDLNEENFKKSFQSIKEMFPSMMENDILNIILLSINLYKKKVHEKIELVITAPNNFKLKALKTSIVVDELIKGAKKSITLTGYSISEYFSDYLDILVEKSRKGIYINLYINNFNNMQDQLDKLNIYKGKFLKIYNYNKGSDKMAALHAKIIVVDGSKSFVSSSNLSYHGLEGNIEMGVLVDSSRKAAGLEELLRQLKIQKIFTRI